MILPENPAPTGERGILGRFYNALEAAGFLLLGRAEMLFTHTDLFIPTDLRWRVFAKVNKSDLQDRTLTYSSA